MLASVWFSIIQICCTKQLTNASQNSLPKHQPFKTKNINQMFLPKQKKKRNEKKKKKKKKRSKMVY